MNSAFRAWTQDCSIMQCYTTDIWLQGFFPRTGYGIAEICSDIYLCWCCQSKQLAGKFCRVFVLECTGLVEKNLIMEAAQWRFGLRAPHEIPGKEIQIGVSRKPSILNQDEPSIFATKRFCLDWSTMDWIPSSLEPDKPLPSYTVGVSICVLFRRKVDQYTLFMG